MRPNLTNWNYVSAVITTERNQTHLLLLHQLRVGAVIDNILTKDGSSQRAINLFCVNILELSVEDEVVAFCIEADSHLAAEENKGEDIAVLLPISALSHRYQAYNVPSSAAQRRTCTGRYRK